MKSGKVPITWVEKITLANLWHLDLSVNYPPAIASPLGLIGGEFSYSCLFGKDLPDLDMKDLNSDREEEYIN